MREREARAPTSSEAKELGYSSSPSEGARISEEVVTTSRPTLTESPSYWLDRLIVVSSQLPYGEGEESVISALIEAIGAIVPDYAVGVRMPAQRDADSKELRSEPPSGTQRIRSDTARMFPDVAHERSVALPDELGTGGAVHFASGDPALLDERAPIVHFLQRTALIAGEALRRAQATQRIVDFSAELRALKAHMVQAEKLAALGQIAAGMVHELNNPLTSIVAYTDFLLRRASRQPNADPDDTERLRRIAESANRMLRFTRDLVSYARPSSEVAVPVSLHTVIHRALAFCEHELVQAESTVECLLDPKVTHVRGMPEQLAQIFVNLVTNACHAMAPPPADAPDSTRMHAGKLTITTELTDGDARVRVIVADTGHGITPSNLPHVFAPFFTTKGAGRGTGLGLSIVKNIVEGHNGTIRAESDPPNGTRFIIVLPADPRG